MFHNIVFKQACRCIQYCIEYVGRVKYKTQKKTKMNENTHKCFPDSHY